LRERVLAIMTLIAQYVMENPDFSSETDIVEELLAVGYDEEEIDAAFNWMETVSLSLHTSSQTDQIFSTPVQRIYSSDEIRKLSLEARGFLVRLRNTGIIDEEIQEEILDRALQTDEDEVTLKEMKTVTALTLFSRSQEEWQREVDCIIEEDWGRLFH